MIAKFAAARRAAAPIIVIEAADPASAISEIKTFYQEKSAPLLQWDISRGVMGLNPAGGEASKTINENPKGLPPALVTGNPISALQKSMAAMPSNSILFMLNLHIVLESPQADRIGVIQCVWNCRDEFKSSKRTLVLVGPRFRIPPELANDVVVIEVPLPDRTRCGKIVTGLFKAAGLPAPDESTVERAVDAVIGLSEFQAENAVAMSINPQGLNYDILWSIKRSVLKQVAGLTVAENNTATFADIAGCDQVKQYCQMEIGSEERPALVVLIDEIGDQMAGRNDSNGLNADAQSVMLQAMEDNGWGGAIFHGVAGTAKTQIGKAMGAEARGLFINFDMGSMKGSLVSESERKIRAAMGILWAMGGSNVFFIGTTNSVANLTPQLMRRFTVVFFFDLLERFVQDAVWAIYKRVYGIADQPMPQYAGWTGAEIRKCCYLAKRWKVSLVKAAKFITPVVKSMGADLDTMRREAHGKYLSASKEGFYDMNDGLTESAISEIRQIGMEEK